MSSFFSNAIQSMGSRVRTWLEANGIEVRVHYEANGVQHDRILVGSDREQSSRVHEPVYQISPLGTVALIGASAIAAGAFIHSNTFSDPAASLPALSDDDILAYCAEVDSMESSDSSQESCTVCMDSFIKGQRILILPCLHKYHKECILPWLRQSGGLCSICRHSINSFS